MALPPHNASTFQLMMQGIKESKKRPTANLHQETVLITGSNSGIGLACAQILPTYGIAHLIMTVRNAAKGEAVAAPIRKAYPNVKIEVWELDMLSYPSIQSFAARCKTLPKLDIAILNAGCGGGVESRINASTGHEETIQVNYLSTALLSILLLPLLTPKSPSSPPGRLTIVGSGTSFIAKFENQTANPLLPSFDQPFSGYAEGFERYSTSKLLVCMLAHKLAEYVPSDKVIINNVEPGLTSGTSLHRDYSGPSKYFMATMKKLSAKTPEQAAWTYIDAVAVHGKESHGGFIAFGQVAS